MYIYIVSFLGPGLFSGAFAVSFTEVQLFQKVVSTTNGWTPSMAPIICHDPMANHCEAQHPQTLRVRNQPKTKKTQASGLFYVRIHAFILYVL